MELKNTGNSYGFIARALHWMTALVILAVFPLGLLANGQNLTTDDGIHHAFFLFSLHKTTGILSFTIGVARLFWTLSQPRPAPIHQDRPIENFAASAVHWTLTIALIAVPLAGWLSHAATTELAPIWWPFGQDLPFVPKNAALSEGFGATHRLFTKLLLAAVTLHVIGALKHLLFDHDQVFARMWRGTASAPPHQESQITPALTAVTIWAVALTAGVLLGLAQTKQFEANTMEWTLANAELILIDANGDHIATATAFGFLLVIDPGDRSAEKGTLDLTVPLDALEGPGAELVTSEMPFPILQFLGTVHGTSPTLSAIGPLTSGNLAQDAEFRVVIEPLGARVTGTATIPGAPDIFLSINALALRP